MQDSGRKGKIQVVIADSQFLTRKGLEVIMNERSDIEVVAVATTRKELFKSAMKHQPDVLAINYDDEAFGLEDIGELLPFLPSTKILAITADQPKEHIQEALDKGITGHVLKMCGKDEIVDAVYATAKGEKFFCNRVVDALMNNAADYQPSTKTSEASCDPLSLSEREVEIIRLIAQGHTNKEIAGKLFLSAHTVTTHRKNIMGKLGISNTAGLVMYAVRTNIINPGQSLFSS